MVFDFLFVVICFYLSIPGVVAYTAASYGRSFWKWFALGMVFPIISHIWLYVLISKDLKARKINALLKKEEIEYMEQEIRRLPTLEQRPNIPEEIK